MKLFFKRILICFLFFSFSKSCSKKKAKIVIVCTTTMIADLLKNIVGENCEIVELMHAGVDPHSYKPTYSDVKSLNEADLVFFNGLHLEGKMSEILENSKKAGKPFYAISETLNKSELIYDPSFGVDAVDPHIWFDVQIWILCTEYITTVLCEKDPKNSDIYKSNAFAYIEKLKSLDDLIKFEISKIPNNKRILISAHDAFSYFGRRYNFQIIGLQGISTVSEAGINDISKMVSFIKNNNVKAIFLETSVPEGPILSVVEGCKRSGYDLKIGGHLYSDSLGNLDGEEGTYLGMMNYNITTISNSII